MDKEIYFNEKHYGLYSQVTYEVFKGFADSFKFLDFIGIYNEELVMLRPNMGDCLIGLQYSNGITTKEKSVPTIAYIYKEV